VVFFIVSKMGLFIVDVETTGTDPVNDRVIEIGVLIIENFNVVDTFTTLINPHRSIPDSITRLTGINDHMVRKAPDFAAIAERLEALAKNRVMVAQNVMFDHGFLENEMRRTGKRAFSTNLLCSRDLSMSLWPDAKSHSLSSIASRLNHNNIQPHRALPDAEVIVELLSHLHRKYGDRLANQVIRRSIRSKVNLTKNISSKISELPESTGVYYLLDKMKRPLYIGKAINIRQRVQDHFSGSFSRSLISKNNEYVAEIKYNLTYDQDLASILEDHEIRQHWPQFNSTQKRPVHKFSVLNYYDQNQRGRIQIIRSVRSKSQVYFFTRGEAEQYIKEQISNYSLSRSLCGIGGENSDAHISIHNKGYKAYVNEHSSNSDILTIYSGKLKETSKGYLLIRRQGFTIGIGFVDLVPMKDLVRDFEKLRFNSFYSINPGPFTETFSSKLINSGSVNGPLRISDKHIKLPDKDSNLPTIRKQNNLSLFL
jgi:DNA polymerase-3 subunit epsilon